MFLVFPRVPVPGAQRVQVNLGQVTHVTYDPQDNEQTLVVFHHAGKPLMEVLLPDADAVWVGETVGRCGWPDEPIDEEEPEGGWPKPPALRPISSSAGLS